MKLWTMLAGLAVAGILASSVYAADDTPNKEKGRHGHFQLKWSDFPSGTTSLTQAIYTATAVAKLPTDMPKERKDRVTKGANARFIQIANAGLGVKDATASSTLNQEQYEKGVAALRSEWKGKHKKGGDNSSGGGGN